MQRNAMAGLFLTAVLMAAFAQTSDQKSAKSAGTEQALKELENRWVGALAKGDAAAVNSVLADGYVETDETRAVNDKQGVLGALKSGDLKFDSLTADDMQVHQYGD